MVPWSIRILSPYAVAFERSTPSRMRFAAVEATSKAMIVEDAAPAIRSARRRRFPRGSGRPGAERVRREKKRNGILQDTPEGYP